MKRVHLISVRDAVKMGLFGLNVLNTELVVNFICWVDGHFLLCQYLFSNDVNKIG